MTGKRFLGLAACAAACAVVTGCSSAAPASGSQLQAGRAAVMPAAKDLRGQVVAAGVGWTALIIGQYWLCGANDPLAGSHDAGMVQYSAQQMVTPFAQSVAFPTFSRQMAETLRAGGWDLRARSGPSAAATYYSGRRDGIDLWLILLNDQQGLGPEATIFLSGSCLAGGSSASKLIGALPAQVNEPRPASTPAPRYS